MGLAQSFLWLLKIQFPAATKELRGEALHVLKDAIKSLVNTFEVLMSPATSFAEIGGGVPYTLRL